MERCKHDMIADQCASCKALREKLFPPKQPEPVVKKVAYVQIIRRRAVVEEQNRIAQAIRQGAEYLGDIMGAMAQQEHGEEGGIEGMCAGSFSLTDEEMKVCMFEALFTAGVKEEEVDMLKVVETWAKQHGLYVP